MMLMAFQSSPIFSLPRARLESSEVIFRFMRSVGVCVLLIIMDAPGEKRLASVKRYEGRRNSQAAVDALWSSEARETAGFPGPPFALFCRAAGPRSRPPRDDRRSRPGMQRKR